MNKEIYIAEDEDGIRLTVKTFLESEGYVFSDFPNGDLVYEAFLTKQPDLVILDVMMPGSSGFEITKKIRDVSSVPIIILTAKDSDMDYATGINLGSDDYFTKPFSAIALNMRVKAMLRRIKMDQERMPSRQEEATLRIGDIEIDLAAMSVKQNEVSLNLTPNEYSVFVYLIENKNRAASRDELLAAVFAFMLKNKPLTQMLALTSTLALLTACSTEASTTIASSDVSTTEVTVESTLVSDSSYSESNSTTISFSDQTITVDGSGAAVDGSILTITQPGTYILSGTLSEGQIRVATDLQILCGDFTITTGGGSANSSTSSEALGTWAAPAEEAATTTTEETPSTKGLKATGSLAISGGTFVLDTPDDSIHTNDTIQITGGDFTIASGDDGIHADNTLTIDDGTININQSYEGIEAIEITLNGGNITLTSTDDGVNTAGGNDAPSSADALAKTHLHPLPKEQDS